MNVLQATLAWDGLNGAAQGRSCASGHLGSAPVTPAVSAAEPESKVLSLQTAGFFHAEKPASKKETSRDMAFCYLFPESSL